MGKISGRCLGKHRRSFLFIYWLASVSSLHRYSPFWIMFIPFLGCLHRPVAVALDVTWLSLMVMGTIPGLTGLICLGCKHTWTSVVWGNDRSRGDNISKGNSLCLFLLFISSFLFDGMRDNVPVPPRQTSFQQRKGPT
ncbi:hypothetical protein B0T20DRAFT_8430 [Sordaria brevicollis]|uniref:Uncharacterized protein n=1 Tax=Sordaria brevicollis TaxID=83679 RepID=A0AAE0UFY0_SORBR|nr:hypothetical protein B0T20DRAFT_8430 [Sordaria brevicollis]